MVITVSLKSPDLQIMGQMVSEVLLALKCLQFNGSMIPGFNASIIPRFYGSNILRLRGSMELPLGLRSGASVKAATVFWGFPWAGHQAGALAVDYPQSLWPCQSGRWGDGSTGRWSHLLSPFLGDRFWGEIIPSSPHCSEMLCHIGGISLLPDLVLYSLCSIPSACQVSYFLMNFFLKKQLYWDIIHIQ